MGMEDGARALERRVEHVLMAFGDQQQVRPGSAPELKRDSGNSSGPQGGAGSAVATGGDRDDTKEGKRKKGKKKGGGTAGGGGGSSCVTALEPPAPDSNAG